MPKQPHTPAWQVGPSKKRSLWQPAALDEQVDAFVQLPQQKEAHKGDVVFALRFALFCQGSDAGDAAAAAVQEQHAAEIFCPNKALLRHLGQSMVMEGCVKTVCTKRCGGTEGADMCMASMEIWIYGRDHR